MLKAIPGVDKHVQTKKVEITASVSLAVKVVGKGIIVDSGRESNVESQKMSVTKFSATLRGVEAM